MRELRNAYALVVGIANYQHVNSLPQVVLKDAQDIANLLVDADVCGYPPNHVRLLLDDRATKAAIFQELAALATCCDSESTVFLYFSSHGGRLESGLYAGEYLAPVDILYTSVESVAHTAIASADFTAALRSIPARKVVVIFDCCHSGGIGQPKDATVPAIKTGLSESYYDALKRGQGRVILASSRSSEYSYVLPGADNSLFTMHLLTGLQGGIQCTDGLVRNFDLFEYLQPRVTGDQPHQHPVFKAEVEENFPIALYLGGKKCAAPGTDAEFRYDAYVSYVEKEPDASWVWSTLLPRLQEASLRVAVSGDVEEPGVARVVTIERGIKQSKRTIVVLSESYLADRMAGFEAVLAQTMGIQEGNYRLLPVRIEPILDERLPIRLSMLTSLNFAYPQRAGHEFERLIRALQGPLPFG